MTHFTAVSKEMKQGPQIKRYIGYLLVTLGVYALVAVILIGVLVPPAWIAAVSGAVLGLILLAGAVSLLLPLPLERLLHDPVRALLRENDRALLEMTLSRRPGQAELDAFLRDWDIEAAPIQSVMLMAYLMESRPDLSFPSSLTPRLSGVLRFSRFQTIKKAAHLNRLGGALNRAGIPFVLLKGGAMKVYRPDFPRWMSDIDILVPETAFDRAEEIAVGLGYAPSRTPHSTDLHLPGEPEDGLLDLHFRLEMNTGKERGYSNLLLSRSHPTKVYAVQGLLPGPEDMVFITLVNLFKNLAERSCIESVVTTFFDIGFLVRSKAGFDWAQIRENAVLTGTPFQVWMAARFLSGIVQGIFPDGFMEDGFAPGDLERQCVSFLYDRDVIAPFMERTTDFDLVRAVKSLRPLHHLVRSRRGVLYLLRRLRRFPFWERTVLKYRYALKKRKEPDEN